MGRIVAILGGGNGGQAAAADLTLRGFSVRLYEDSRFAKNMSKVFEKKEITLSGETFNGTVRIPLITSDMKEAVTGAEIVFVIVPAFAHKDIADSLAGCVLPGQLVVVVPGTLGSLLFANTFRQRGVDSGVVLAETSTLPYDCRIVAPGEVYVYGMNAPVLLGVFPSTKTAWAADKLADLYAFTPVTDVMDCGLHSLNPVVHVPGIVLNTGRIERSRGEFWLYEEGMTPTVCRVIEALDCERMEIAKAFGYKVSRLNRALSGGREERSLWEEINGSASLTPIKGPTSVKSRYFTEDIPYGLVPWSLLADMVGVETPVLDSFIVIGGVIIKQEPWKIGRTLEEFGIAGMSLERLKAYLRDGR